MTKSQRKIISNLNYINKQNDDSNCALNRTTYYEKEKLIPVEVYYNIFNKIIKIFKIIIFFDKIMYFYEKYYIENVNIIICYIMDCIICEILIPNTTDIYSIFLHNVHNLSDNTY